MVQNNSLRALWFRSLRFGFRLAPMSAALRDRLRQRFLDRHSDLLPQGPSGKPPATTALRTLDHAAHRFLSFVPRRQELLPTPMPATIIAFYLPQFHPIAENDAWWGKGFTEWRNVGRALPQFEGHVQPRLPGDLGYYDLRLPDVMREQMAIARDYGVGAFCTYFYWFAGRTLLETPLRQWLNDSTLDLPMCLCWANENWSRRWDGRSDDVLIGQAHSAEDDLAFIAHVSAYIRDPRYLRVDGKPILLVYRPGLLPEPRATAARWRDWCRLNGVGEIHLAYVQSFDNVDPASIGFDAAVAFPPNNVSLDPVTADFRLINPMFAGQIFDWRELASEAMSADDPPYRLYPAVNPGWDNEARRSGRGRSFLRATPRAFSEWTRSAIATARRRAPAAPLVFVNAWNEWAEGAILEPDATRGYAWLAALRRAVQPATPVPTRPCAVIDVEHPEDLDGVVAALRATDIPFRTILTVARDQGHALATVVAKTGLNAEVVVSDNHGDHVTRFLRVASDLLNGNEDVVLKLRTTRPGAGSSSGVDTVTALTGAGKAALIVREFTQNQALGLVVSDADSGPTAHRGNEHAGRIEYLRALLGLPADPEIGAIPADRGMFWCRLGSLAALVEAPLSQADFAIDAGAAGMSGAVEALLAAIVVHGGFHAVPVGALPLSG